MTNFIGPRSQNVRLSGVTAHFVPSCWMKLRGGNGFSARVAGNLTAIDQS
ncbi:hypothetical protein H7I58_11845 [Mycolicibacterium moriokaense]|jgi:hypothetical protein|nr:hypothetical protein [Mycolicibacterium moriokaense]MCV7039421.1 hypothetical protein [Mycolicibacterium moriokaense]